MYTYLDVLRLDWYALLNFGGTFSQKNWNCTLKLLYSERFWGTCIASRKLGKSTVELVHLLRDSWHIAVESFGNLTVRLSVF